MLLHCLSRAQSLSVVQPVLKTWKRQRVKEGRESEAGQGGTREREGGRDGEKWRHTWRTMTGKFRNNGAKLEKEKTVSVFQWIGGEAARPQAATPPYLLPPLDNGSG